VAHCGGTLWLGEINLTCTQCAISDVDNRSGDLFSVAGKYNQAWLQLLGVLHMHARSTCAPAAELSQSIAPAQADSFTSSSARPRVRARSSAASS
jgi:hypothetical protein